MALIVLSEDRIARELARSQAAERRMQAEQRRLARLLAVMFASVLAELACLGVAMAVIDEMAVLAAMSAVVLCGTAPFFIIVIDQLRRD